MPAKPSRARVTTAVFINLAATPGLGSLMCRRFVAGIGQLLLAVAGFGLLVVWMCWQFTRMISLELNNSAPDAPKDWLWKVGVILFAAGWVWSLVTSISLLREAKAEQLRRFDVPPKL